MGLLDRVLEIGMPKEFPEKIRKSLGRRRLQAAEEDYDANKDVPWWPIFAPPFVKDADRKLARQIKSFWSRRPQRLLDAVPCFTDEYFATDEIRSEAILNIIKMSLDMAKWKRIEAYEFTGREYAS